MLITWCIISWIGAFAHLGILFLLPKHEFGIGILAQSTDCPSIDQKRLLWSLFLNVVATVMFKCLTYGMQCLGPPTRTELDKMHEKGQSMMVGTHSLWNILNIPPLRQTFWVILAAFGLPLHAL